MIQDISNDFLDYQYQILGISPLLERQDVTEICINKPGQVYLEILSVFKITLLKKPSS